MKWVLVTGAREYPDMKTVVEVMCIALLGETTLVHGQARGVDQEAKFVAETLGKMERPFPYRGEFGRAGGAIRNQEMVDFIVSMLKLTPSDTAECYAFPLVPVSSKSGTRDCMKRAIKAGIPVHEYPAFFEGVD